MLVLQNDWHWIWCTDFERMLTPVMCASVKSFSRNVYPWVRQISKKSQFFSDYKHQLLNATDQCDRWTIKLPNLLTYPGNKHNPHMLGRKFNSTWTLDHHHSKTEVPSCWQLHFQYFFFPSVSGMTFMTIKTQSWKSVVLHYSLWFPRKIRYCPIIW